MSGQFRMITQNFGQPIKRNSAVEVMHMVNADVSDQPLNDFRQIIKRAACNPSRPLRQMAF